MLGAKKCYGLVCQSISPDLLGSATKSLHLQAVLRTNCQDEWGMGSPAGDPGKEADVGKNPGAGGCFAWGYESAAMQCWKQQLGWMSLPEAPPGFLPEGELHCDWLGYRLLSCGLLRWGLLGWKAVRGCP